MDAYLYADIFSAGVVKSYVTSWIKMLQYSNTIHLNQNEISRYIWRDIEHTCEVSPSAVRFGLHFACATCSVLSLHSTVHQNGRPYGFHVTIYIERGLQPGLSPAAWPEYHASTLAAICIVVSQENCTGKSRTSQEQCISYTTDFLVISSNL